ncbi:uncharacterized protein LOC132738677 isoform X2 [Ruditapes philippinarum]|nr:uncharacterized protein LOC132738677 isoform X2 [Ruditapes philippinarum]XP_060582258.1 uncharacterized protein LOC132738677 isoform X2 [Ruditapes philippinarum]
MNITLRTSLSIAIVLLIMRKDHTDACCFPSQFEGQLNILMPKENNAGSYKEKDIDITFDWTKRRIREYFPAEGYVQLLFFEKAVSYIIQNSTCSVGQLSPFPYGAFCVPDNAKRMKSYTLGMKKQINVTDYLYTMDQMQILRTISDKCVPVADLYFQEKSNFITYMVTYQNLTPGIKDEKVFDVPSFCKSSTKKKINSRIKKTNLFWDAFV